jgi:hypothetical protein
LPSIESAANQAGSGETGYPPNFSLSRGVTYAIDDPKGAKMGKFMGRFYASFLLAALAFLAGCGSKTPVPTGPLPTTPVPSLPSPDDCLVGEWELSDFADTIVSILPSDIKFQYAGTGGRIHWTFDPTGYAVAEAYNFSLTFADKTDPTTQVTITTNGIALRDYKITSPGEITFSQPDDSAFTYTATIDGVTINADALFKGLIPTMPAQGTIAFSCHGTSLDVIPPAAGAVPEGFVKVH